MIEGNLHHAALPEPCGSIVGGQAIADDWCDFIKDPADCIIFRIILKNIFDMLRLDEQVSAIGPPLHADDVTILGMQSIKKLDGVTVKVKDAFCKAHPAWTWSNVGWV